MLWRRRDNACCYRRQEHGDAHRIFPGGAGERIRSAQARRFGGSGKKHVEFRRRNSFRDGHIAGEFRRFFETLERGIARAATTVLSEILGAAEAQTARGDRAVVAPFVAMMVDAGNDRRIFRDGEESGSEAHRRLAVQEPSSWVRKNFSSASR